MARILLVSTYPCSIPRHGGQVRVAAIFQAYRTAGHDVRNLAIYRADEYPEEPISPWNIHFSWKFINELLATGGRTDINAPDFLLREPAIYQQVSELIEGFKPEIVQLEQCWLWPMIKPMAKKLSIKGADIIYSSQNIEYLLLKESTRRGQPRIDDDIIDLVKVMELDLVSKANLVVAVSEADAAVFKPIAQKTVLAPNGISPRASPTGSHFWKSELKGRRVAIFIGSAHPPNASGFIDLLGPSLGYLSPTDVIIVVGGVCNLLTTDPEFRANIGLNMARLILAGIQDEGGLSTLIEEAHVVLVPIIEGGGTNIKMAEALYNRKLVLCTPKAVRGYERFLDMPFILERDGPEEFKATLTSVFSGEFNDIPALTRSQAERLKTLLWPSTLSPLVKAVNEFAGKQSSKQTSHKNVN